MQLIDWLVLFAVCAAGAVSPGPSLLFILATRARYGARAAVAASLGHGLGVGIYALAAVAGVATLLATVPAVAKAVELIGATYLLWLSWQFWPRLADATNAPSPGHEEGTQTGSPAHHRAAVNGLLVALLNPKIVIYFAGVVAAVAPTHAQTLEHAGIALMAASIDGGWYALVSVAGGIFVGFFAKAAVQRVIALLLAAAAMYLLVSVAV